MNNLAQIDLRCLGASGKVGLFGRRQSGPIIGFVHNAQSSGLLPEVKSYGSDSQRLESIDPAVDDTAMDKYDIRRSSLRTLILQLQMTQARFGTAAGYSGKSIGQFLNRSKRDGGGEFLITEKVVDKIIRNLKAKSSQLKLEVGFLDPEWFDTDHVGSKMFKHRVDKAVEEHANAVAEVRQLVESRSQPPADVPVIDDEKFPEHLATTWPYMNEEQRNALRYLEAGFRSKRNRKR